MLVAEIENMTANSEGQFLQLKEAKRKVALLEEGAVLAKKESTDANIAKEALAASLRESVVAKESLYLEISALTKTNEMLQAKAHTAGIELQSLRVSHNGIVDRLLYSQAALSQSTTNAISMRLSRMKAEKKLNAMEFSLKLLQLDLSHLRDDKSTLEVALSRQKTLELSMRVNQLRNQHNADTDNNSVDKKWPLGQNDTTILELEFGQKKPKEHSHELAGERIEAELQQKIAGAFSVMTTASEVGAKERQALDCQCEDFEPVKNITNNELQCLKEFKRLVDGKVLALVNANKKILTLETLLAEASTEALNSEKNESRAGSPTTRLANTGASKIGLQKTDSNIPGLETSLFELRTANEKMKEELTVATAKIHVLESSNQDATVNDAALEEVSIKISHLKIAFEELKTSKDIITKELAAAIAKISELESSKEDLTTTHTVFSDTKFREFESLKEFKKLVDKDVLALVDANKKIRLLESCLNEPAPGSKGEQHWLSLNKDTLHDEYSVLMEKLTSAEQELTSIRGEKVEAVAAKESLKTSLQQYAATVELQRVCISELESDKERSIASTNNLEALLQEMRDAACEADKRFASLQDQLSQSQIKNDELARKLDLAEASSLTVTTGVMEENKLLRIAIGNAKKLMVDSNDKILNLLGSKQSLESSLEQAELDLKKITAQRDSLQSELQEARDEQETIVSRSLGITDHNWKELQIITTEREALKTERDGLQAEVIRYQRELEKTKSAMQAIELERDCFRSERRDFESKIEEQQEELEIALSTLDALRFEIRGLEAKCTKILEEKKALERQMEEAEKSFAYTKAIFIAKAKENADNIYQQLQYVVAEKEGLQTSLDEVQAKKNKEKEHREYLKAERSALVNQINKLEEKQRETTQGKNAEDYQNDSSERALLSHVAARLSMTTPEGFVRGAASSYDEQISAQKEKYIFSKTKDDSKEDILEENERLRETIVDLEVQLVALDSSFDSLINRYPPVHGRKVEANDADIGTPLLVKFSQIEEILQEYNVSIKETSERLETIVSEKLAVEQNMESVAETLKHSLAKEESLEALLDEANEKIADLVDESLGSMDESQHQNRQSDLEFEKRMIQARITELQDLLKKKLNEPEDALMSEESLAKELNSATQRLQELEVLTQREVLTTDDTESAIVATAVELNSLREEISIQVATIAERERRIEDLSNALSAAVAENYVLEDAADTARRQNQESLDAPDQSTVYDGSSAVPSRASSKRTSRYLSVGDNADDKEALKARVEELENRIRSDRTQMAAVQERLDSVQKEKVMIESQLDLLQEEQQKAQESRTQLESSLKASTATVKACSHAIGDLETLLLQQLLPQDISTTFNKEHSLEERIQALSSVMAHLLVSDSKEFVEDLDAVLAEKRPLEFVMEQNSRESVVRLEKAGEKWRALEERLQECEKERDDIWERATMLQGMVNTMEKHKEDEIHLMDIVMSHLRELDIHEIPTDLR